MDEVQWIHYMLAFAVVVGWGMLADLWLNEILKCKKCRGNGFFVSKHFGPMVCFRCKGSGKRRAAQ